MLVSVIVPIYNSEKFLEKSLSSLKEQSYKELEILLINDGSTDRSIDICKKYTMEDSRFKLFNKENGGVSSARNLGLKKATGEYIGFVDPDDWIDVDMFKTLVNLVEKNKAELAICGYIKEHSDGTLIEKNESESKELLTREDALNLIIEDNSFRGYLCNKIFSRNLIKETYFDENIIYNEDLIFCCDYIMRSNHIAYDSKNLYHYIIHGGNISARGYDKRKIASLKAIKTMIDQLINSNIKFSNLYKFKEFYMHTNISFLMNGKYNKALDKEVFNELKNNLYAYKLGDYKNKSIKISCGLCRINSDLFYLIWKLKKSK